MENGRRKVWICLLVIVLAAVVVGILYYLSSPQQPSDEGFLIRDCRNYRGLGKGYYRIAVKGQEDNEQLLDAMRRIIKRRKESSHGKANHDTGNHV